MKKQSKKTRPTATETPAQTAVPETPVSATPTETVTATPTTTTAKNQPHVFLAFDEKANEMYGKLRKEFPTFGLAIAASKRLEAGTLTGKTREDGKVEIAVDPATLEALVADVRAHRATLKPKAKPVAKKAKIVKPADPWFGLKQLITRATRTIQMYKEKNKIDFSDLEKIIADASEVPIQVALKISTTIPVEAEKAVIAAEQAAHAAVLQKVADRTFATMQESGIVGTTFATAKGKVEAALAEGLANLGDWRKVAVARNTILEVGSIFYQKVMADRVTGGRVGTSNRPLDEFRGRCQKPPRRQDARGTHGGQRYSD